MSGSPPRLPPHLHFTIETRLLSIQRAPEHRTVAAGYSKPLTTWANPAPIGTSARAASTFATWWACQ